MGSSASKAARTASTRKYPSHIPTTATTARATNAPPASTYNAAVPKSSTTHDAPAPNPVTQDDDDAALAARMRQLGPVTPSPTLSNSSTFHSSEAQARARREKEGGFQPSRSTPSQSIFPNPANNPAVMLLAARAQLAADAEREFEDVARLGKGREERRFLDVWTIRSVLKMRDVDGKPHEEIEETLGLGRGVVSMLGPKGVVGGVEREGDRRVVP